MYPTPAPSYKKIKFVDVSLDFSFTKKQKTKQTTITRVTEVTNLGIPMEVCVRLTQVSKLLGIFLSKAI